MKHISILFVILLLSFVCFSNGVAEDSSQWALPENANARIGRGQITDMAYSPDGKLLAVGTTIGAWLYDVRTGDEVALLSGLTNTELSNYQNLKHKRLNKSPSVSFSPDGNTIAIAGWDQKVRLWDVGTRKYKTTLIGSANTVRYSPDGSILGGVRYAEITLWDANTHKLIRTLVLDNKSFAFATIAFSPDGKTLASADRDNNIHLWKLQTGLQKSTLTGHKSEVKKLAFSPDGTILASGDWNNIIRLWDLKTEKRKKTLIEHEGQLNALAFSLDGTTLASGGFNQTIHLWDSESGEQKTAFIGHKGAIYTIVFCPDGSTLASGSYDGTIIFWNTKTGEQRHTITHTQHQLPMTLLADGKTLASQNNGNIMFLNVNTRQIEKRLILNPIYTSIILMSRDGTTLASGIFSRRLREMKVWNVQTGKVQATFTDALKNFYSNSPNSKALSPDGKILALGKTDTTVELWDTHTGKLKTTLRNHKGWVSVVAFSPDGRLLVSSDHSNVINLWDATTGKHESILTEKYAPNATLVFSPDGLRLAGGDYSGVWVWDMKTRKRTHIFKNGSVSVLAFSKDGTKLAGASLFGVINVWDLPMGQLQDTFFGHSGSITSLAFLSPENPDTTSLNKHILASTSEDGTVLLWKIRPTANTNEVVKIAPHIVESAAIGERFKLNIDVAEAKNVKGYQVTMDFDTTILRYVSSEKGDYLPADASFATKDVYPNRLKLISKSTDAMRKEDGTLASITYEVIATKPSIINLPRVRLVKGDGSFARPITVGCSVIVSTVVKQADYTQFALPEGAKARLGKGIVNDIKLSPDKTLLAVASSAGIWLYDAKTGDELVLLTGHTLPVSVIAFSPHGDLLVSGSYDGTLRLWNPYTHQLIRTLKAGGKIAAVTFSPDGRTLANASGDGIQLWDTHLWQDKLRIYRAESSIFCLAFSPDGKTLASGSLSDNIQLWNAYTGEHIFTFDKEKRRHITSINYGGPGGPRLAFSPDGQLLASTAVDFSGGSNQRIQLWNTSTGQLKVTLEENTEGLKYPVSTVQFSADGKTLISGSRDGTLRKWDLRTGENIKPFGQTEYGKFNLLRFLPDNTTLVRATQDNAIHLLDIKTGKTLLTLTGYGGSISSVALSPDGTTLATVNDKRKIELWDMQARRNTAKIEGDTDFSPLTFSPDGRTLASGIENEIKLWDTLTQQHKTTLTGHRSDVRNVVFSPNGRTLASSAGNMIWLWDVHTGEHKTTLQGHTSNINALAFSSDGTMLASGSGDRDDDSTVRLWNTKTGKQYTKFRNLDREHHEFPLPITTIAFSPDGKIIASIDRSADIQLWNIVTKKHITTLTANSDSPDHYYYGYFVMAFSPDGTTLTSTGYNSTINVWDIEARKRQDTLKGHTGLVTSLAYSVDGTTLVSGSTDGTVLLWQMRKSPLTRLNITPFSIESPPAGTELTFMINMTDGQNVDGYKFNLQHDATALRFIPNPENAPKIKNVKAASPVIAEKFITLSGKASDGAIIEDGTIATVTFEVIKRADVTLTLTDALLTHKDGEESRPSVGHAWVVEPPRIPEDANRDWQVDAADLEFVSSRFGQTGKDNSADVNKDGIVDLADLVLVANALNGTLPNHTTE